MANRNFTYAPGLPGFGTRGIDGSTGLQGLAYYFSEFDGVTDTVTIKTKILSNKILFSIDELLPGYPARTYQTGDLFMDTNGLIWSIDLNESNKYKSTAGSVAGDEFFEFLKDIPIIGYSRWSNNFTTSQALVDVVLRTGGAIDYTSSPTDIYVSQPDQAAQWKYVNVLSPGNGQNYYPFTIFSNGSNDNAMAIVRDQSVNTWHIGNLDENGVQRNIDLQLDFSQIKLGPNVGVTSSQLYSVVDLSINGNVNLDGDLRIFGDGSILFEDNVIYHDIRALAPTTPGRGKIRIITNTADFSPSVKSGDIQLKTGNGFLTTGGAGGISGLISISTGVGGFSSAGSSAGDSGQIDIFTAPGGQAQAAGNGGDGGSIQIIAGRGGENTTSLALVGRGGNMRLDAGTSGQNFGQEDVAKFGWAALRTGSNHSISPQGGDVVLEAGKEFLGADDTRGDIRIKGKDVFIEGVDSIRSQTNFWQHVSQQLPTDATTVQIDSGGFFGLNIDVSSAFSSAVNIKWRAGVTSIPALNVWNSGTSSITSVLRLQGGANAGTLTNFKSVKFYSNSNAPVGIININGTTPAFVAGSSDIRLKGNIKDISINGLDILNSFNPREFQYKKKDPSGNILEELETDIFKGYIAQEAEPFYPDMVYPMDDGDKNDPSTYLTVGPTELNIVFHKAIQELSAENTDLKNRVSTLENQVAQLIAIVDPSIT